MSTQDKLIDWGLRLALAFSALFFLVGLACLIVGLVLLVEQVG